MRPTLFLIIPCYNEEQVLPITGKLFLNKMNYLIENKRISSKSKIVFVNDGSTDTTWDIIKKLNSTNNTFQGLSLSRNRGHQNALLAGLMECKNMCDISVSIDCDGQDDINAIDQMIDKYNNGYDVVYGVRSKREKDSLLKRFTAESYYKLLNLMGAEVIFNHADYRLLSSRVLNELANYKEVNLFLRGMVPLVGFKSTTVLYEREERIAGKSHYTIKKMFALAFDGITSLSIKPIRLITGFGVFVAILSFFGILWSIIRFLTGATVPGWASTTSIICFVSGVQLISLGVIGEYIGKIYLETKSRPRYIVEEKTI